MDIWRVLEYTMTATVVGIMLWVFKIIFHDKLDARWHYFIWLVLLVRLALPIGLNYIRTPLSVFQEFPVGKWLEKARIFMQKNGYEEVFVLLGRVYLLGALLLGTYYLLTWLALRVWIWQAPEADVETREYVETIGRKYGLKGCRNIRICISSTPYICGVIFPVLVLPRDNIRPDESVIVHELLHNKYKDVVVNILLRLVRVVHWFNPIIWGLTGLIQTDNEALCDQRVLEYCSECSALDYGETLIRMSEVRKRNSVRVGTSNMASSYRHMKIRIGRIRDFGRIPAGVGFVTLCITLMLAAASAGSSEVYGFEVPELGTEKELERALLEAQCYHAHTPEEAVYIFLLALKKHNPVYRMAVMPQAEIPLFEEYAYLWLDRKNADWTTLGAGGGYPAYFPQKYLIGNPVLYNLQTDGERGSVTVHPNIRSTGEQAEWKLSLRKEEGWKVWLEEERVLDQEENEPEPLLYGSIRMGDYLVESILYNEGMFEQFYAGASSVSGNGEMNFPIGFSMEYKSRRIMLTYLGQNSLEGHQIRVVAAMGAESLDEVEMSDRDKLENIKMSFGEKELEDKDYLNYSSGTREGCVSVFDGKALMTGVSKLVDGYGEGFVASGMGWKADEKVKLQIRIYVDGVIAEEGEVWDTSWEF